MALCTLLLALVRIRMPVPVPLLLDHSSGRQACIRMFQGLACQHAATLELGICLGG
jgi:hypothetical protein